MTRQSLLALCSVIVMASCTSPSPSSPPLSSGAPAVPTQKHVEVIETHLSNLIDPDAQWEVLSDGYQWSEGPAWDKQRGQLYFTDVPSNTAYLWRQGSGTEVFLQPSGSSVTEGFREPGANGLFITDSGELLLANHGARAVQRINLDDKSRTTLVGQYQGQTFNSPNDVVQSSNGDIFFSDPPYGLEGLNDSPLKDMDANGVYRLSPDGAITRLADTMSFPNGVALSPDESRLYVAQSDPNGAAVFTLDPAAEGPREPQLFFDMQAYLEPANPGLPDGFAIAATGEIFVTGPGGIFILSEDGELLGRIYTGSATANVTFGGDNGRSLFITAQDRLLRIPTKVQGAAWN